MHDDILRIDSLQDRLSELEDERTQFLNETCEKANIDEDHDDYDTLREEAVVVWETQTPEGEEWLKLTDILEEVGNADYLINENHFKDYVQELLQDCGAVPSSLPWYVEIDWEATANNVWSDYSTIEIDGHTYYYQ